MPLAFLCAVLFEFYKTCLESELVDLEGFYG